MSTMTMKKGGMTFSFNSFMLALAVLAVVMLFGSRAGVFARAGLLPTREGDVSLTAIRTPCTLMTRS